MQTLSTAARNALNATSRKTLPRVIAEWNYNRFVDGISVTNAAGGRNDKVWPIDSLVSPRYTDSGLTRAIVGEAKAHTKRSTKKFRGVSVNDIYKYWVSPTQSDNLTNLTGCEPTVNYGQLISVNRLVIKFDVEYARPDAVTTYVIDGAGNQIQVGTTTPDAKGRVVYNYNGSWGSALNYDTSTDITGIRVVVSSMSAPSVHAHVIEISARLLVDLSDDVESVNISKMYEDQDLVLPTGVSTSNECNISLANDHGFYNPENTSSPYYGFLDENVLFEVAYGVETSGGIEYIQQGIFYSDSWGGSTDSVSVDVSCRDSAKFLQEMYAPESLFQHQFGPPPETTLRVMDVVRELLARVGWGNIKFNVVNTGVTVPYIWYRGEEVTIWQALQDIARAVPATFYFDEFGTLVWEDADYLYNKTVPSLDLDYDVDLINLSHDFTVTANDVTVRYNNYDHNRHGGSVVYSELWAPEGDIALRVAELRSAMTEGSTFVPLNISDVDFSTWPETGIVRIGQERIRYGGKTQNSDPAEPNYDTINHPALVDLERGILGTAVSAHTISIAGTLVEVRQTGSTRSMQNGYLRLATPGSANYKGYTFNMFGETNTRERYYSTRVMFPTKANHNIGGLTIHQSGSGSGYFLELTTTALAQKFGHGEVRMYKMDASGNITELIRTNKMRGVHAEVGIGIWYRLEIEVQSNQFACYVNGSLVGTFTDDSYTVGNFAPYIRGATAMHTEYIMAGRSVDAPRLELFQKNGTTAMDSTYASINTAGASNYHEFGALVHEGREFNVEYDVHPAIGARVINTNELESVVVDRRLGPFRGHFIVENYSRTTAILSGEDTISELGYALTHSLFISGQAIVRASEEVKEIQNQSSIQRRGREEIEISTPWIQGEVTANRVAQYVIDHWSEPVDIVNVNWVPNPAIQLGDLVSVNFPDKGYTAATHHYYVTGIEMGWDEGLNSVLTLRRRR